MATEQKALEAGVRAVIYGLPLVMMDLTKQSFQNAPAPRGAPINQFLHVRAFPPASFKQVVRVNVDTLYSSAFLDLSEEPLLLSVSDTHGRYYLLPLFDAWTNVFATLGTRTTGNSANRFLIAGPDWSGTAPAGVKVLRSPTNTVWLLGRTQTNGPEDYSAVHAVQDGYKLVPLSKFGASYVPAKVAVDPSFDAKTPPVEMLMRMSAAQYFDTLARLLKASPPPAADAPVIAKLASIGIVPGQPFDPARLDPSVAKELEESVSVALQKLQEGIEHKATTQTPTGHTANGWRILPMTVGNFGTSYEIRAIVALGRESPRRCCISDDIRRCRGQTAQRCGSLRAALRYGEDSSSQCLLVCLNVRSGLLFRRELDQSLRHQQLDAAPTWPRRLARYLHSKGLAWQEQGVELVAGARRRFQSYIADVLAQGPADLHHRR
jgi:hypothetical protein